MRKRGQSSTSHSRTVARGQTFLSPLPVVVREVRCSPLEIWRCSKHTCEDCRKLAYRAVIPNRPNAANGPLED